MAKCKKMAVGGVGAPAPVDPKMAAMMAARKKARPLPGPAAGVGGAQPTMMKKGGKVKKCAKGGGIETKGKTRGKIV